MEGLILVVVMAIIVEALVEYGKSIAKAFAERSVKTAVTQLVAIGLGILLCFASRGDLFSLAGVTFGWPWLGMVLTGIIISRGANYVSDFVKRLTVTRGE